MNYLKKVTHYLKMTFIGILAFILSCNTNSKFNKSKTSSKIQFIDRTNIDTSVSPANNFFYFANGNWLKNNPIPPSQTRWGTFTQLQEENLLKLKNLAEQKPSGEDTVLLKITNFYKSGMDSLRRERTGLTPLQPYLQKINNLRSKEELWDYLNELQTKQVGILFHFDVQPDDKNVTKYIAFFSQAGLGMPDRDYYLKTDERTIKVSDSYKLYLLKILKLANPGDQKNREYAEAIYQLEKSLAKASLSKVDMRDPYKIYHKLHKRQVDTLAASLQWSGLFEQLGIQQEDSCIIGMPEYFKELAEQFKKVEINIWKQYIKFHLMNQFAPYLNNELESASFEFYGKVLRGQQQQRPRWKRVLGVLDAEVGELLGKNYVNKYFHQSAKDKMNLLVDNLQKTFESRINRLDWMSDQTKSKAMIKLNTIVKKIGFPDVWRDFTALEVGNDYLTNVLNSSSFNYDYNIHKLGKPVNKREWFMSPQTVNAYYNPTFNEIVFPAAILQHPFFSEQADDAINYGGIGAVIGHEMTHGFDDQGRQFDAQGYLKDWWIEEDATKFQKKSKVVVDQFNGFKVLDSLYVNGELTLGENIADLGGLSIAFEAFKNTEQGRGSEKIDGFTPDQRFFLSWAQVWRANTRPEELAARLITDPHSPSEFRCNGPLSNMPSFHQAFHVKPGDPMFKKSEEQAYIW